MRVMVLCFCLRWCDTQRENVRAGPVDLWGSRKETNEGDDRKRENIHCTLMNESKRAKWLGRGKRNEWVDCLCLHLSTKKGANAVYQKRERYKQVNQTCTGI